MKLRLLSVGVLFHGDDLLMMKRSATRTLHPGTWAAVGGHMEPFEITNPEAACRREIFEETGFDSEDIKGLKLHYILLRLKGDELRQQFFYIGETSRRDFVDTDEGFLSWVPKQEVLQGDREIPYVYRSLLAHYFTFGPTRHPWVGTASMTSDGEPIIHWLPLLDPVIL
ncbi:MAG: NUDIX hydrolase [Gorillibacterium sp.]|nr:NUDIX hydrolase [Gorillibacterium sp.]